MLWTIFAVVAIVTAWTEREVVWLFLLSGVAVLVFRARRLPATMLAISPLLLTGVRGTASTATLGKLALYFAEAGAFVFGSGLAIVPFLYGGIVEQYHWLTQREFLDAVAVAMITPGPVVITVGFIGYLVAGPIGAVVAAAMVFLPCYLFVVIPAPYYERWSTKPAIANFVDGVTAAATGAIAGAAWVLGRRALVDWVTVGIAIAVFAILTLTRKVPEPLLIAAAAVAGLLLR